jgi:outer membrane protein, multidrug efflux system
MNRTSCNHRPAPVIAGILPVLLILVSGCLSSPSRNRIGEIGFEPPGQWSVPGVSAEALTQPWWMGLGSTNLANLVAEALAHNPDLEIAAARLGAAEAEARIAGADLTPSLGATLGGGRAKQNFIGLPIPGNNGDVLSTRFNSFGVSLTSSWELDIWGRIRSGKRAALAEVWASELAQRGARQSIAAQSLKAWSAVVESTGQFELAQKNVNNRQATVDQVRQRYELGLRSPLDLRLAETQLASAQAMVAVRSEQRDRATRQFETILGRYPSGTAEISGSFPDLPDGAPAGLPSELLDRRPDLAAAKKRVLASDHRLAQAKAALFPRISLTASGGTSTAELRDLVSSDFGVWTLAGNLSQPLLQGGRLRAGVQLARTRVQQSLAEYRKTALRAYAEVESALAAEGYARTRQADLTEATRKANAALDLARARYTSGVLPYLALLESERTVHETESQLITARHQRLLVRIDLHLALGGGFYTGLNSSDAPSGLELPNSL